MWDRSNSLGGLGAYESFCHTSETKNCCGIGRSAVVVFHYTCSSLELFDESSETTDITLCLNFTYAFCLTRMCSV